MGEPSTKRVWAYRAILIITPILLLVAVELILGAVRYGGHIDLVVPASLRGKRYLTLNRSIGGRIFGTSGASNPEPTTVYFLPRKPPGWKRIFCIGESTMQGFPYEFNATPAAFLENRLRTMMPQGDSVEVINAGLSAIGSYVIVDFLRELVRYEPDLIIVYSGHNEFYGAYGAGSSVALHGPAWMTSLHLRLLHYRTYLLVRDALARVQSWFTSSSPPRPETLMERMIGRGSIPRQSETYRRGLQDYRDNLEEMIAIANGAHVPIMFSALVCNLRDQRPFLPDSADGGRTFDRGREEEQEEHWDAARSAYRSARDGDELRFRASTDFENELRSVCATRGVLLSPVDSLFASVSPHGLVGNNLILEHLHPNLSGYALMADAWVSTIRGGRVFPGALGPAPAPGDSAVRAGDGVTEFDRLIGQAKVGMLTHRWPFVKGSVQEYRPEDPGEAVLVESMREGRSWSETRYRWADRLTREGRWPEARKEYVALARSLPWSFQPWVRLGDAALAQGNTADAETGYRRALDAEESAHARMKLGALLLRLERPEEALAQFSSGLAVGTHPGDPLSTDEQAAGWYLTGVAAVRLRRIDEGTRALERALAIRPGMREAKALLDRLKR
jgi:tetratricopeptide (TPR) repeat protein